MGEVMHLCRQGIYGKPLDLLNNFVIILKLLKNNKVFFKKIEIKTTPGTNGFTGEFYQIFKE